ncbi:hypothetical protein [Pelagicoccus sp. SDUM812003]|uniref:GAP1-N2 domain-containing protein n=1 Tax=Pelagicoccus sp. SDUM812003 TaxID=3041267 RepID=UPI00280E2DC9|nr:hypothetical protein [Pelagicoccus sp. SDUM812003]MDQ8205683.1 hypothetical protein [Pelagicoccus sp. SDUM812003]
MSYQYIHTSAKRGLEPGKSGYCCVARDMDLPPDLAKELDRLSRFQAPASYPSLVVLRHRIAELRSGAYHILSRIQETGADYSKRNNHLAHHLVFEKSETTGLPNPSSILLNWRGWRTHWNEPPRILDQSDAFSIHHLDTQWKPFAEPEAFPSPFKRGEPYTGLFPVLPGQERSLVEYFGDCLNQLDSSKRWRCSFTNCLLPTDDQHDTHWCGVLDEDELPFDLDLKQRPIFEKPKPEPPPQTADSTSATARAAAQPSPRDLPPPVVEIPQDYDRRSRRRPRRFGLREFARSINFAIAVGALLCIALAVSIYQIYQTKAAEPNEPTPTSSSVRTPTPQSRWQAFLAANCPPSELGAMTQLADQLPLDSQAPAMVDFLAKLRPDGPMPSASLPVPARLIQTQGSSVSISLATTDYPGLKRCTLLPSSGEAPFIELRSNPILNGLTLPQLPHGAFSRPALDAWLDFAQLAADRKLQAVPEPEADALRSYFQEKESLLANRQLAPFFGIHQAFGRPETQAYLGFDESGLIYPNSSLAFAPFLRNVFAQAVAESDNPSLQNALFLARYSQYRKRPISDAYSEALAIQDLMEIIESEPNQPWFERRQLWKQLFGRDDLMEQTILRYSLESLEASKLKLVDARQRFTVSSFQTWSSHQGLVQSLQQLRRLAQASISDQEWVVIAKQTSNVGTANP